MGFSPDKNNIVELINSGQVVVSFVSDVKNQASSEAKDLSRAATDDFIRQGEANEIEKNKEVFGVGIDATKSFLVNCYNQAVLSNITEQMSNDEIQKVSDDAKRSIEENINNCKNNIFENHIENYFKSPEQYALEHPEANQYQINFTTSRENAEALNNFFSMQEVKDNDGNILEKLQYDYDQDLGKFQFKMTDEYNFYAVKELINNNATDLIGVDAKNKLLENMTDNFRNEHGEWLKVMELAEKNNITNFSSSNLSLFMKNEIGLSDQMYDRIMGLNEFAPEKDELGNIVKFHDMFDYTHGAGGLEEWDLDNRIIEKLYNSDLKGLDGKNIFEDFQIISSNGNRLDFKNINLKAFEELKNAGFFERKEGLEKLFKELCKFKEADRELMNFRSHDNLQKLLFRFTGIKQMTNEYKEYSKPLTPFKAGKKAYNVGASAINAGYRLSGYIGRLKETQNYKKAYDAFMKNATKENKMLLEKATEELRKKIGLYNIGEKRLNTILHPFQTAKKEIAKKVMNTKLMEKVTFKKTREKAKKWLRDRIYEPIGKIFRKPLLLIMKILKPIIIGFALFFVIFLIMFLICMGATTSSSTATGVIGVTPLAEDEDFEKLQKKYDELDNKFINSIEDRFLNYADTTNLKGDKIYYGVNGLNNEEGMVNDNYKNGVHYNYIVDEDHTGRTSNIEDLISMTAIMLTQQISELPDIAIGTLEWLYNLSHK